MPKYRDLKPWRWALLVATVLSSAAPSAPDAPATPAAATAPAAPSGQPITIGFGMALTGGLAPNGRSALLAMQLWESEVNAKGGLLGRPVKLVYYDDQSNPSTVPGLYTKLLDVDKVDLVISGYGTNMIAPALPVIMQHNRTFLALFGLAVNSDFNYPNYFSITPMGGPEPKQSFSKGFFEVAMAQNPKPTTLALTGADAEFPHNALEGARVLAKQAGLKIVYDRSYPPTTNDYTPIVRGIQAANPDLVFVASYPPDTVGIIRAASEIGLKAKLFGGGMVGLQSTAIKTQLGPLMNGIVDYDVWQPVPPYNTPETMDFLSRVPGEVSRGRRRPARLLPAAVRLCRHAGSTTGGRGGGKSRSAETRRLPSQPYIQDGSWRFFIWSERRVDRSAGAGSTVPEREGQRRRAVQEPTKSRWCFIRLV